MIRLRHIGRKNILCRSKSQGVWIAAKCLVEPERPISPIPLAFHVAAHKPCLRQLGRLGAIYNAIAELPEGPPGHECGRSGCVQLHSLSGNAGCILGLHNATGQIYAEIAAIGV